MPLRQHCHGRFVSGGFVWIGHPRFIQKRGGVTWIGHPSCWGVRMIRVPHENAISDDPYSTFGQFGLYPLPLIYASCTDSWSGGGRMNRGPTLFKRTPHFQMAQTSHQTTSTGSWKIATSAKRHANSMVPYPSGPTSQKPQQKCIAMITNQKTSTIIKWLQCKEMLEKRIDHQDEASPTTLIESFHPYSSEPPRYI